MKLSPSLPSSAWSRFIHAPITLGVFLLITCYTSTIVYAQWKKEREWNARVILREVDVRAARERHDALKARVAYAESEVGKDEYVRQSFDVAQRGEALIILPETKKEIRTEIATEPVPALPWWREFMAKIFNL